MTHQGGLADLGAAAAAADPCDFFAILEIIEIWEKINNLNF